MTTLRLDSFLPYRLSVASNAVSDRIAEIYRLRFGLKVPEWRLIAILAEHERLTPQALGRLTRMDKITVSRAATALKGRALIEASRNADDGRSHHLALTDDGRTLYRKIAPLALTLEAQLLTPDERAQLAGLLRRIETAADALPSGAPARP